MTFFTIFAGPTDMTQMLPSDSFKIHIFDFLTGNEQIDVLARTGIYDLTSNFNAWTASIPNGGAVLYAPRGFYLLRGTVAIAKPFTMEGAGPSGDDGSGGATNFGMGLDGVPAFAVSSPYGLFRDLAFQQVAATNTAGSSAVLVDSTNVNQVVNYDNISTQGFYDTLDVRVGASWFARNCLFMNAAHWGIRNQNRLNVDVGGARIRDCRFFMLNGSQAGIRWETGGGAVLSGNVILSNGVVAHGIDMALTGISSEMAITDNIIEHCSDVPLQVAGNNWEGWNIYGNRLRTSSLTAPGLKFDQVINLAIGSNVLQGAGGLVGMTITNCNGVRLGTPNISGFGSDLQQSGNTNFWAAITRQIA
jgi:hypothetical protein